MTHFLLVLSLVLAVAACVLLVQEDHVWALLTAASGLGLHAAGRYRWSRYV